MKPNPTPEDPRDTMRRLYAGPDGSINIDEVWADREALRETGISDDKPTEEK